MLFQTNTSDLLVDLSTEKQELLAGGCKYRYSQQQPIQEQPTQATSPVESSPVIAPQPTARMVVGNIITVTPFAKCLSGQSCFGGSGS